MFQTQRAAALALVVVTALAVGACGAKDTPRSDRSPTSPAPHPSNAVVVEPLETIPGAERINVDGVGIDLAPGYVRSASGNQPDQTAVQISKKGSSLAVLTLTVTRFSHTVTDGDLDAGLYAFRLQAQGLRGVTNIADIPVVWDVVAHPLGLEGVEHPTAENSSDLRVISGREADGDRTVALQVWAEPGTSMEDSDGWRMARTVRFDSAGSTAPPS